MVRILSVLKMKAMMIVYNVLLFYNSILIADKTTVFLLRTTAL